MVLKDVRSQVDAKSRDWVQLYESCSAQANDEQVLVTCDGRERAVDAQAERVAFQPYLARPGLKGGLPVVLVEQLSRGIGTHTD